MKKVTNTFNKLNSDINQLGDQAGIIVDAVNAAFITEGSNQLVLHNKKGAHTSVKLTEGFTPVGVKVLDEIAYIVSATYNADGTFLQGEVGTYPSPDWDVLNTTGTAPLEDKYSPLHNFSVSGTLDAQRVLPFRTNKFNFADFGHRLELELQSSYDDTVNIVIIDKSNTTRIINSRMRINGSMVTLGDRDQVTDGNTYSASSFILTELIRKTDLVPNLEFLGLGSGGSLPGGSYRVHVRYADTDGNTTDVIESSLPVHVFNGFGQTSTENTGKTIRLALSFLDTRYSFLDVSITKVSSEVNESVVAQHINRIYPIISSSLELVITGYEDFQDMDLEMLNLSFSSFNESASGIQIDQTLVLGNISSPSTDYRRMADLIAGVGISQVSSSINVVDADESYGDPMNLYYNLGVWSSETYELAMVCILSGGRGESPAFPLRGIDNVAGSTYTYDTINELDGFKAGTTENRLGIFRTKKGRSLLNADLKTGELLHLHVNVANLLASAWFKEETAGFFIVKRLRVRDCIVQGMLTNTYHESSTQSVSSEGNHYTGTSREVFELNILHSINKNVHPVCEGIGKNVNHLERLDSGWSTFPAPGRIQEVSLQSQFNLNNINKSVMLQGVVSKPLYINENKGEDFAFYSGDGLLLDEELNTRLNATQVGLTLGDTVVMKNIEAGGSAINDSTGGTVEIFNYTSVHTFANKLGSPSDGRTQIKAVGKMTAYVVIPAVGASFGMIRVNCTVRYKEETIYPDFKDIETYLDIKFTDPSVITGDGSAGINDSDTLHKSIGDDYNIVSVTGLESSGIDGSAASGIDHEITLWELRAETIVLKDVLSGKEYTLKDGLNKTSSFKRTHESPTIYTYEAMTHGSASVDTPGVIPAEMLFTGPVQFTETKCTNSGPTWDVPYNITATSISDGTISGPGNFSSVSDRALYYERGALEHIDMLSFTDFLDVAENNVHVEASLPGKQTGGSFYTSMCNFNSYIGVNFTGYQYSPLLAALSNDASLVASYPSTVKHVSDLYPTIVDRANKIITSKPMQRFNKRMHDGFNFGVTAKIYNGREGILSETAWKAKYGSSIFGTTYTQATKRFSWSRVTSPDIKVLDGDCFLGKASIMPYRKKGLPGTGEGDASLFNTGNEDAGSVNKGFVFPLVAEHNANIFTRLVDVDKEDSGKTKSFHPMESVASLRGKAAGDSRLLNFGYTYNEGLPKHMFNITDPTSNSRYRNRVIVSKANITKEFKNGYSDFSGLNFRDYGDELGSIVKLEVVSNTVIVVFTNGVGIIPFNERTMVTGDGGSASVYIDDAQVLGSKLNIISYNYGSKDPYSIVNTGDVLYGMDYSSGKVWAVVQGAFSIISDFNVSTIIREYKEALGGLEPKVVGNFDKVLNDVVFSFYTVPETPILLDTYEEAFSTISREDPLNPAVSKGVIRHLLGAETKGEYSSVYYNKTTASWVSRLSYSPSIMFNIGDKLNSFDLINGNNVWSHFSDLVPTCHVYGNQGKFIFEFILAADPHVQKIITNMQAITNYAFPGRVTYTTADGLVDFESFATTNSSTVQLMKRYHEPLQSVGSDITTSVINGAACFTSVSTDGLIPISKEESERIAGGFVVHLGVTYIIGISFLDSGLYYNEVLNNLGIIVSTQLPTTWGFDHIEFGIIHQTMDYIEDELYIEVATVEGARVRDKGVRVKFMYEGYDHVKVQGVITTIIDSFN